VSRRLITELTASNRPGMVVSSTILMSSQRRVAFSEVALAHNYRRGERAARRFAVIYVVRHSYTFMMNALTIVRETLLYDNPFRMDDWQFQCHATTGEPRVLRR